MKKIIQLLLVIIFINSSTPLLHATKYTKLAGYTLMGLGLTSSLYVYCKPKADPSNTIRNLSWAAMISGYLLSKYAQQNDNTHGEIIC